MADESLLHKIALMLLPGVGDVLAKSLVSYCGSAEEVFRQKKSQLIKIPDIGPVTAASIISHDVFGRAEKEVNFIGKYKISALFYTDKAYPQRLKHCNDAPAMLYYKGNADLNKAKVLGIVGTRKSTEYGKSVCEELIKGLAHHDVLIVSGLAYGIDICAHKLALKYNLPTVGALGHGLDRIYPAIHKSTAEKMIRQGGLLTEFMSETKPNAENFPARNRVVAGMCDAVVIVEAAIKGGALITAEIANSYNRDVFAIPGKLTDEYSQGCNHLIKTNKAFLAEKAEDIEYILGWERSVNKPKIVQRELFVELNPEEQKVYNILTNKETVSIDLLVIESSLPVSKVAGVLLNLEFKGLIRSLPGKLYSLT